MVTSVNKDKGIANKVIMTCYQIRSNT